MRISDDVNRIDSADKLRGKTKYIEDMHFKKMLFAKTLRSPIAKGRIKEIVYPDLPPGVHIIDYRDVPANNEVAMIEHDMPIFAKDFVTYTGEPLALVIGEDKNQVIAYMERIVISYEEDEAVFNFEEALNCPEQIITEHCYEKGNLENLVFDEKLTECFATTYQEQLYMEKQGMVGMFDDGVVTVYGSLQCPYYVLNALKHAMGLDETRLRVVQAPTGGAFGGKEEYPSLLACQLAVAAYKLKHPVRLIFDRREDIAYSTKRHPSRAVITSYIKDRKVIGLDFDISLDAGSYLGLSDVVLQRSLFTMPGAYAIDHLRVRGRTVRTNNVFTGAFRGFGAPQSMYALELHMNHIAKHLGEEPLEFRRKHYVKQGDLTGTSGRFNEEIHLDQMSDMLKAMAADRERSESGNQFVGYGVSVVPHGGGFTGDGEAVHIKAVVKLRKELDGRVTILVSNVEMGQGAITTLTKIVASVLDIELEQVRYETPDTFEVPDSGPTVASRTTMVVGALLARAADKLKERLNEPNEITITERFKQPDYVKWNAESLKGNAYMAYSWSVVLARVEVDPISYEVKCTDVWGAYDVGVPIDKKLLLGQIHGGVVQGLGYALMENMTTQAGQIEQIAFASYPIPTTMDTPKVHADWILNPYQDGPFGAKSVGELTIVGVAPAIAAAIEDAVGITTWQIPVTPEVIERSLT